jgi:hypothetical protein
LDSFGQPLELRLTVNFELAPEDVPRGPLDGSLVVHSTIVVYCGLSRCIVVAVNARMEILV